MEYKPLFLIQKEKNVEIKSIEYMVTLNEKIIILTIIILILIIIVVVLFYIMKVIFLNQLKSIKGNMTLIV